VPGGAGYVEAGLGMGDVLRVASEQNAYTLTDRATFLSIRDRLDLEILVEGDARLYNQYAILPLTSAKNEEGARAFRDWITSPEAQALIGRFGVETFGQPLFVPNARGGTAPDV
jgi:tungstate transport system substrate-binding protein